MEVKRNLNNQQRKMLDTIYTQQFDAKERSILDNRNEEFRELRDKVLNEVANSRKVKALLTAGQKFFELYRDTKNELTEMGFDIDGINVSYSSTGVQLKHAYSSSNSHPKLQAHNKVTNEIRQQLNEKRMEMRSRIYGMSTTYDEVKIEVEALLAKIG